MIGAIDPIGVIAKDCLHTAAWYGLENSVGERFWVWMVGTHSLRKKIGRSLVRS